VFGNAALPFVLLASKIFVGYQPAALLLRQVAKLLQFNTMWPRAARLSSSRVDWPAQTLSQSGTKLFQSYFMNCFNCTLSHRTADLMIVLNLMQPFAAGRHLVGFGWKARRDEPGREGTLQHAR
jgi:hypothetical protein